MEGRHLKGSHACQPSSRAILTNLFVDLQVAKVEKKVEKVEETLDSAVDALELDDLEVMSPRMVLSNEASGGRTGQAII